MMNRACGGLVRAHEEDVAGVHTRSAVPEKSVFKTLFECRFVGFGRC